jgi:glycosyltransferase involved in cell wall biosynthesis
VHLFVAGKSAFSRVIDGRVVPITIAGHTAQFMRPLMSYARSRGMAVSYAYPLAPAGCLMADPFDELPEGVLELPFADVEAAKAPLHIGYLSIEASLRRAVQHHGPIDWVFIPYAFPLSPLFALLKQKYGFKLALFLRGGDGYQWPDGEWPGAVRAFGDARQARIASEIYRESLEAADFVGVASAWLGSVVERFGGRWDAVVESPAAMRPPGSGPVPADAKAAFCADPGVTHRFGRPDPAKRWIVSAGRIHPDKNLDLAAEIFAGADLDDWQLVLSGVGADEAGIGDGALADLVKRGSACVVETPPRIVYAVYEASDAYLQTSLPSSTFVDARPSSVTSAAFHGKPVVVPLAAEGGVAESLSPENLEIFGFDARGLDIAVPADRAALVSRGAAAVRALARDELREKAGQANARHAAESSVDAVFDKVWAQLGEPVRG